MQQSKKITQTGSFINWINGNNNSEPKIGEGATELMWSDRHAFEVIEVSQDKMSCTIQRYKTKRSDKNGMSDSQGYIYDELTAEKKHLVWRKKQGGCWCTVSKEVKFIPKFLKDLQSRSNKYLFGDQLLEVYGQEVYDSVYKQKSDDHWDWSMNIVEGITKEYTNYHKISVLFGSKQEYYDYSF